MRITTTRALTVALIAAAGNAGEAEPGARTAFYESCLTKEGCRR
jgi:hypothetical protein